MSRILQFMMGASVFTSLSASPISCEEKCDPCDSFFPCYANNVFISADFIYWVAKQEGNTYAATGSTLTVPGTVDPNTALVAAGIPSTGRVYAPDAEVEPGFKVSLGIDLAYDRWDLSAEYTFLHGKADGSVSSSDLNSGVIPLLGYIPNNSILSEASFAAKTGATGFVSGADSDWTLHFNNVNLELGKWYPFSCNMQIRPHFGLQSSWQTQHMHVLYTVNSLTSLATALGFNKVNYRQTYWGVGLRFGIDTLWKCANHFSLFLDSAFSLLWGQVSTLATSYDTNPAGGYSNMEIANQAFKSHSVYPVIGLVLGFQSDWWVRNMLCVLQAGWEMQAWFDQNQRATTIADTLLLLQGLTVKLRTAF